MRWVVAILVTMVTMVTCDPGIDEFLTRQKRFINSEDYDSMDSKPKYLVAIQWANPWSGVTKTICSGSIIHEDMVLTSGGCLFHDRQNVGKEAQPIANWQLSVVAGVYDFESHHQMNKQVRDVVQVYTHPDLQMTDHRKLWLNDIAIIHVNQSFTFNDHVGSINLWLSLFAYNDTTTEYYTMLRASGFGDGGSPLSVQYEKQFKTHDAETVSIPRYHYFAYVGTEGGSCGNKFPAVSDIEDGLVTLAPELPDPYSPSRITSGKRCFYTGTREIVGYLPTDGDWGGPIVWTSPDNFQDYQVFLMPKMPAPRATFETDQNYQMWGEWLAYYDRFIGEAWDHVDEFPSSDRQASLIPTNTSQTYTKTVPIRYFGDHQWLVKIDFNGTMEHACQVNITFTGEDSVTTMRNSIINLRKTKSNKLIRNYYGALRTLTSDVVTTPSSEGSTEGLWGCEYKDSSEVKPPAQDPKVFETTDAPAESSDEWITVAPPLNRKRRSVYYDYSTTLAENTFADVTSCKDALYNGTNVEPSMASFTFKTYWETISKTITEDFYIEIRTKKPRKASDKGSLTIKIDYMSVEMPELTEEPASVTLNAPIDGHAGHKRRLEDPEARQHDHGGHGDHGSSDSSSSDSHAGHGSSTEDEGEAPAEKESFKNVCDTGFETCDDQFSCFHQSALCDMEPDCLDSQDEFRWCLDKSCLSSEYQCITGECLKLQFLCDGTCDCLDKTVCEDETLTCDSNLFPDRDAVFKYGTDGPQVQGAGGDSADTSDSDSSHSSHDSSSSSSDSSHSSHDSSSDSSSSSSGHDAHGGHGGHKKTTSGAISVFGFSATILFLFLSLAGTVS